MMDVLNPACAACGVMTPAEPCPECGGLVIRLCGGCRLNKLLAEAREQALSEAVQAALDDLEAQPLIAAALARSIAARIEALKVVKP